MRIVILSLFVALISICCKSPHQNFKKNSAELNELVAIMQGHYTSEKQSISDKDYFNISLRMTPIWRSKGNYLFVEQAIYNKQDQPYRVRIYKLTQQGDNFISSIYTVKDEKAWIGKWATPEVYNQLTENDIEIKTGCEVVLNRVSKNTFEGATGNQTCPSELRGASWANSKVTVTENSILSWDQGFDKEGKQVWGATKGGYQFIKM